MLQAASIGVSALWCDRGRGECRAAALRRRRAACSEDAQGSRRTGERGFGANGRGRAARSCGRQIHGSGTPGPLLPWPPRGVLKWSKDLAPHPPCLSKTPAFAANPSPQASDRASRSCATRSSVFPWCPWNNLAHWRDRPLRWVVRNASFAPVDARRVRISGCRSRSARRSAGTPAPARPPPDLAPPTGPRTGTLLGIGTGTRRPPH